MDLGRANTSAPLDGANGLLKEEGVQGSRETLIRQVATSTEMMPKESDMHAECHPNKTLPSSPFQLHKPPDRDHCEMVSLSTTQHMYLSRTGSIRWR